MENSTFKIQASISFLESFVTSHFFGIFRKKLSLNLPVVPEKFILSETALNQLNKSISIKNIDITFLDTAKGKQFLTRYLEELRLLKPEYRDLLVTESVTHPFVI
jgi:hypothetical protein